MHNRPDRGGTGHRRYRPVGAALSHRRRHQLGPCREALDPYLADRRAGDRLDHQRPGRGWRPAVGTHRGVQHPAGVVAGLGDPADLGGGPGGAEPRRPPQRRGRLPGGDEFRARPRRRQLRPRWERTASRTSDALLADPRALPGGRARVGRAARSRASPPGQVGSTRRLPAICLGAHALHRSPGRRRGRSFACFLCDNHLTNLLDQSRGHSEAEQWWRALAANDEETVCEAANTAFSDNPAAGCAVGVDRSVRWYPVRERRCDFRPSAPPVPSSCAPA